MKVRTDDELARAKKMMLWSLPPVLLAGLAIWIAAAHYPSHLSGTWQRHVVDAAGAMLLFSVAAFFWGWSLITEDWQARRCQSRSVHVVVNPYYWAQEVFSVMFFGLGVIVVLMWVGVLHQD